MINPNDCVVIIAALNEEKTISQVITNVKKFVPNVIVVSDGSTDSTVQNAKKAGAIVIEHVINLGKGAAVKTGCAYALENNYSYILLVDADGQHDPKEIPLFLKELNKVDMVFGFRNFNKEMPFILKIGNIGINTATKILYGISLKDTQSGYRAFKSSVYHQIKWESNDYAMESEMIANVGKQHISYSEVPIATIYTDRYKGTTVLDGIKIVINMIMWRLKK